MAPPPKYKYQDKETVLCYHGPLLYEAKVIRAETKDKVNRYFVHYSGWNNKWDEWVPEPRVLKVNEASLRKQAELQAAQQKSKKDSKSSKKSRTDTTATTPAAATPGKDSFPGGKESSGSASAGGASKESSGGGGGKESKDSTANSSAGGGGTAATGTTGGGRSAAGGGKSGGGGAPSSATGSSAGGGGGGANKQDSADSSHHPKGGKAPPTTGGKKRKDDVCGPSTTGKEKPSSAAASPAASSGGHESGRGRKRARQESAEPSEVYTPKTDIDIRLSEALRKHLGDDFDFVTRQKKLVKLPCRVTVDDILNAYAEHKAATQKGYSVMHEAAVHCMCSGIRSYFNMMLGKHLLYRFERPQYAAQQQQQQHKQSNSTSSGGASEVYGVSHLLRMMSVLGRYLAFTLAGQEAADLVTQQLRDFAAFLDSKQYCAEAEYATTPADYHRKAVA